MEDTNQATTNSESVTLTFPDFESLQCSIQLMPRVEEEGIGAMAILPERQGQPFALCRLASTNVFAWDFAQILAAIRESPRPIELNFISVVIISEENSNSEEEKKEDKDQLPDLQNLQQSLLSWTSRMRETSVHLAAEAATKLQAAAKERAEAATKKAQGMIKDSPPSTPAQTEPQEIKTTNTSEDTSLGLYIQTSTGAFIPLNVTNSTTSDVKLTNSSLLAVRKSTTEACPADSNFQWFRSSENLDEWHQLDRATTAVFQPSATEVGYRLRCQVTVPAREEKHFLCETDGPVSAALPLFNGARQALVRGAQFGGLLGKGNAEGRAFRLQISMSYGPNKTVTSALRIFQVSGSTAECLHEKPILGASAKVDHSSSKNIALIFPKSLPPSMVQALSTDGRLLMLAPNRLARESMLLALGIANFPGKPIDLTPSHILFGDEPVLCAEFDQNDELSDDSSHSSQVSTIPEQVSRTTPPRPNSRSVMPPAVSLGESYAFQRSTSLDLAPRNNDTALRQELDELKAKLVRKDKIISEYQRQVTQSDAVIHRLEQHLEDSQTQVKNLRHLEKALKSQESSISKMQHDHKRQVNALDETIATQNNRIADLEKATRTLENEKAVLIGSVEAREMKLLKMAEQQAKVDEMVVKEVSDYDMLHRQLFETEQRWTLTKDEMEKVTKINQEQEAKLRENTQTIAELKERLKYEVANNKARNSEYETQQVNLQRLKAERNSLKQKADSLAKEMAKVCHGGVTMKDVERIIADEASRQQEVVLLREQKRKVQSDLEHYRVAYEQIKTAQQMSSDDHDMLSLLERNVELDHLLSELTEYVDAKEMQLETYKQVNEALLNEIQSLTGSESKSVVGV